MSQRADTAKHSKRICSSSSGKKLNTRTDSPLPAPLPINRTANQVRLLANRMAAFYTPFPSTGMQRDKTLGLSTTR